MEITITQVEGVCLTCGERPEYHDGQCIVCHTRSLPKAWTPEDHKALVDEFVEQLRKLS